MKKLLIASSVLAALSMNVAYAGDETSNGGTIEFIGEITDTTCLVSVEGTDNDNSTARTNNTVVLPTVTTAALKAAAGATGVGRTGFKLLVKAGSTTAGECVLGNYSERTSAGVPTGTVKGVTKVRAIFGGPITAASRNGYDSSAAPVAYAVENRDNVSVNTTTGRLKNIAAVTTATNRDWPAQTGANSIPAAANVELQLLDKNLAIIHVGNEVNQRAKADTNAEAIATGTNTALQYYVEYVESGGTAAAGMVRGFVNYDLEYK